MINLRVVFQGGGARLVMLVAAAEALRELEDERRFNVEHIAGVSAGSIAAAMYASRRPIREQIEILRGNGAAALRSLGRMPSGVALVWNVWRGRPLLNEEALETLLHKLFYEGPNAARQLKDLRAPVTIVASDIRTHRRIDYDSTSNHDLARIIRDSCAVPVVFRTHLDSENIVDGGICSNLPVDVVLGGEASRSCVIAFKFDEASEAPQQISNIVTYVGSLLGTAIDAGVEMAAQRVVNAGGHVCSLPNVVGTFDFEKALKEGLRDPIYPLLKSQARKGLEQILDKYSKSVAAAPTTPPRTLSEEISDAHRALMRAFPVRVVRSTTIVVANCLRKSSDPASAIADDVYQTIEYRSDNDFLVALRIGVPNGPVAVEDGEPCDVRVGDERLNSRQILISIPDPTGVYAARRYNLIFLERPVSKDEGPVRILYHSRQRDSFVRLKQLDGMEWIRAANSQKVVTEREEQIVLVPDYHSRPEVRDLKEYMESLPTKDREPWVDKMEGVWTKGALMSDREVSKTLGEYGLTGLELGMHLVGWRSVDFAPSHFCGAAFVQRLSP